jgi:GrpB-like predicted nucleotidyltransferase (UPF0157 family)
MLIQPYQKQWSIDFQSIKNLLNTALCGIENAIEHIGSTAIYGLAAKPIIDIDVVYFREEDFEKMKTELAKIGYVHVGNQGIKDREVFKRAADAPQHAVLDTIAHHLYVCPILSEEFRRHLFFRDYLETHKTVREQYQKLKMALAAEAQQDKKAYAALKETKAKDFIETTIQKAYDEHNR